MWWIATIRAVMTGESVDTFKATLLQLQIAEYEAPEDAEPVLGELTDEMVQAALAEVAEVVFSHDALKHQRNYMLRAFCKPDWIPMRKFHTRLMKINQSLKYFPRAEPTEKFSDEELVRILELAIPSN